MAYIWACVIFELIEIGVDFGLCIFMLVFFFVICAVDVIVLSLIHLICLDLFVISCVVCNDE